jgi:hypothetical protein
MHIAFISGFPWDNQRQANDPHITGFGTKCHSHNRPELLKLASLLLSAQLEQFGAKLLYLCIQTSNITLHIVQGAHCFSFSIIVVD